MIALNTFQVPASEICVPPSAQHGDIHPKLEYASPDTLAQSVDWRCALNRQCVYLDGRPIDTNNVSSIQGCVLGGRFDIPHTDSNGYVGFKVKTSDKGKPLTTRNYKKDNAESLQKTLDTCKQVLVGYNVANCFFEEMCCVLDQETLLRLKKTYTKDMYDVTVESSHVFPKVEITQIFKDPNKLVVDLPENFLSVLEVVRVPDVDMSIRGKLQGVTSDAQMVDGGFCNYVYVVNDDVIMVTINSKVYGLQQLLLDAQHVSLIQNYKIHMTTKGRYAGFRCAGDETSVHIWVYEQKFPEYVPNIKTGLVDHKNHNTLDCRVSNLRNVTAGGNNNNLARREGTNYYTHPMCALRYCPARSGHSGKWELTNKIPGAKKTLTRSFKEGNEDLRRMRLRELVTIRVEFMKLHKITNGLNTHNITCDTIHDLSVKEIVDAVMACYSEAAQEEYAKHATKPTAA